MGVRRDQCFEAPAKTPKLSAQLIKCSRDQPLGGALRLVLATAYCVQTFVLARMAAHHVYSLFCGGKHTTPKATAATTVFARRDVRVLFPRLVKERSMSHLNPNPILFSLGASENPQALRQSALGWQLMALKAQCKAIAEIAREHHIDLSDINPDALSQRVEDLVQSARQIEANAASLPAEDTLAAISQLRSFTEEIKKESAVFVKRANFRSQMRMSADLDMMCEGTCETLDATEPEALEVDRHQLKVGADRRCLKAEGEQDETFAMQINAICDLALEMVLVAAADNVPSQS
jgi:hypothetical protein